jgi:hypothetical protein
LNESAAIEMKSTFYFSDDVNEYLEAIELVSVPKEVQVSAVKGYINDKLL